ncbi:TPA: DUF454 domain-containing protein [bacterium]|nr:DUF454 domain-containing protein [bacterium]
MVKIKRYILISLGFTFLGLGFLGIFLPLLPTTPFLLLSVSCFYKSSQRFHSWLLNHKVFGKIIRNYREKRIGLKTKWSTLIILWLTIGISMYLFLYTVFVPILLFVIVVPVSWHILRLSTDKKGG